MTEKLNNEKLCTILFTSGTTGKIKEVMLNHKNLTDNETACDIYFHITGRRN